MQPLPRAFVRQSTLTSDSPPAETTPVSDGASEPSREDQVPLTATVGGVAWLYPVPAPSIVK